MRFSVWPGAAQPWSGLLDLACQADEKFWHCVYVADHFIANDFLPNTDRPEDGILEGTGVLAALAGATTRVRLANLVLSVTYRHPAVLANWAATVDHISHGRLTLGLGTGWQGNEHRQYGLELGPRGERVNRFAEAVTVISGLLSQPTTTFSGHYYQLTDAGCDPKPVQSPLPLLIAGSGARMLRLVARYAHEWNSWSAPGRFRENARKLDSACEAVGRDPSTIWRSTQALTIVTQSAEEEARAARVAKHLPLPVIYGPPTRIADAAATWRNEGVDEVIFSDRSMREPKRRRDIYDALAEVLSPLT
jgi:alkanesulfonate monooxygenase SsuD/methylene tetrahydromethanopterin reductase-like flavin-dependent oxidoreductase (luciferase family)